MLGSFSIAMNKQLLLCALQEDFPTYNKRKDNALTKKNHKFN